MGNALNITGERYGRLVAVRRLEKKTSNGGYCWLFKCDCGKEKEYPSNRVRSGLVKSCGCSLRKHGMSKTRIYDVWVNMRMRCKHQGRRYWHDKGIKVCDEWLNFERFCSWAMKNGYRDDLTIDRIDQKGDYCPENCRWATYKEQARNLTSNHIVTMNGKSLTITEWVEELNIVSRSSVFRRMREYGWSADKALTTPRLRKSDYYEKKHHTAG